MRLVKEPPTPGELSSLCVIKHERPHCEPSQRRAEKTSVTLVTRIHINSVDKVPARPIFVVDKIHVSNYCFCMFAEQKRSAIKDMAANLEKKWRKLLAQEVSDKMDTETAEGKPRHYVLPHTLVVDEFGTINNRQEQETASGGRDGQGCTPCEEGCGPRSHRVDA